MPRRLRPTAFSAALRDLRHQRGMTMRVVADLAGPTVTSLQSYETGHRLPEPETVAEIAKILRTDLTPLLRLWLRARVGDHLADLILGG